MRPIAQIYWTVEGKWEHGFYILIRRSAMNETLLFWGAYFLIVLSGLGVLGVSWV